MATYKGYSGSVDVDDGRMTVTRSGLTGNMVGGPLVRTIPLQALSAVTFKDATRLVNGHLEFAFGGQPLPPPSKAATDPNTIVFRHKDQQLFAGLYQYLQQVIAWNQANAVDTAGAYAACGRSAPSGSCDGRQRDRQA